VGCDYEAHTYEQFPELPGHFGSVALPFLLETLTLALGQPCDGEFDQAANDPRTPRANLLRDSDGQNSGQDTNDEYPQTCD